jgi:hypothetical protein
VVDPGLTWVVVMKMLVSLVFLGIGVLLCFLLNAPVRRRRRRLAAALNP